MASGIGSGTAVGATIARGFGGFAIADPGVSAEPDSQRPAAASVTPGYDMTIPFASRARAAGRSWIQAEPGRARGRTRVGALPRGQGFLHTREHVADPDEESLQRSGSAN